MLFATSVRCELAQVRIDAFVQVVDVLRQHEWRHRVAAAFAEPQAYELVGIVEHEHQTQASFVLGPEADDDLVHLVDHDAADLELTPVLAHRSVLVAPPGPLRVAGVAGAENCHGVDAAVEGFDPGERDALLLVLSRGSAGG